jgi:toluene monooxygenase system ferredoxin subunit
MSLLKVAALEDLWSGEMIGLECDGKDILLVNVDNHVFAYANLCPHQNSRLSEGTLEKNTIRCARHHWEFDVSSGRGINPQNTCLRSFPVALDGGDILVDLNDATLKATNGGNK